MGFLFPSGSSFTVLEHSFWGRGRKSWATVISRCIPGPWGVFLCGGNSFVVLEDSFGERGRKS